MDLSALSTKQLVTLYNEHAPKPVSRFADRKTAEQRVAAVLPKPVAAKPEPVAAAASKPAKQSPKPQTTVTPVTTPAAKPFGKEPAPERVRAVRAGTKISIIIDLISRKQGATMAELQPLMSPKTTVKNILNYDLNALVGYGYESKDGNTIRIVLPAGMSAPLAHVQRPTAG